MTIDPLDNPVYAALTGPHRHLAQAAGRCLRYPPEMSAFAAFAGPPERDDWAAMADLAGPGGVVILTGVIGDPPPDWRVVDHVPGVQLVDDGVVTRPDDDAVRLGPDDVGEMLALVEATRPGPFAARTVELGTYLGIRHGGRLVAMAGERMHLPSATEISAVCTAADARGRGLASRLVRAVAHGIRARGETPIMHASAANERAVALYLSMGFRLARRPTFVGLRAPRAATTPAGGPAQRVV